MTAVRLAALSPACTFTECGTCADARCEHRCHVQAPVVPTGTAELKAAGRAYDALKLLDRNASLRVIDWLTTRLECDNAARKRAAGYDDEPPF